MIFRGQKWTCSQKVVALPHNMWPGEHHNYVGFGRTCSKNTPGAVKTIFSYTLFHDGGSVWASKPEDNDISPKGDPAEQNDNGEWHFPVYAVPVVGRSDASGEDSPTNGYSLTHLLYGADGYAYLMEGGKFYVRRWRKVKTHVSVD